MIGGVAVSAPGKTILFGEHAAVYGHAALVAALGHRLTVCASTPATLPLDALQLEIPALGIARTVGRMSGVDAVKGPGDLAILAVAITAAGLSRRTTGFHVKIDSSIPLGCGFGSSAALAVAIVAACRNASGDEAAPNEIFRLAAAVERHQHARTSGVDVQAVLRGGLLWCCRPDGRDLECERLAATGKGLDAFRLFHSGTPNETTGEMVATVRAQLDRDSGRVRDAFAAIDAATRDGRGAILRGDAGALVPIVKRAEAALESIGVVPEQVQEAIRAIEVQGGAAKISGAGGLTGRGAGLVLVVHPDPAWHDRFAPPSGWRAHRVGLGVEGLRAEVAA